MLIFKHLRKYWVIATLEAASLVGENSLFIVQFVFRFLRVVVLLAVWRALLAHDQPVAGLTLETLLTYTLIQEVFAEQLLPRTDIEWALHDGGIAMRFLQPISLVSQFTAQMVGRWGFNFAFFSLPLLVCAPLLGVSPLPANGAALGWFSVSLVLTIAVGVALEFIFAAFLSYLEGSAYIVSRVRTALTLVLSGAVVPLALLPWNLGALLQWLPFASLASAPLQIYIGLGDPLTIIAQQLFWAIALWSLSQWLWRVSREKLASYGG